MSISNELALMPVDLESQLGKPMADLIARMIHQLDGYRPRHDLRSAYYDMRTIVKDLGIAVPPQMRHVEVASGWPAKAVDLLARRVRFQGFVLPGGDLSSTGIQEVWNANRMDYLLPQAITSALIHSTAFLATTPGDVAAGEPPVVQSIFDATEATGIWEPGGRSLKAALLVTEVDETTGERRRMSVLTKTTHVDLRAVPGGWSARVDVHSLGRVPVEPLVYRPRTSRPFGSSRITRSVMSITDAAMRTFLRGEVMAEFFSAPQRWAMGADEDQFVGPDGQPANRWSLIMGRLLAIPRDEDGNLPQVGTFPQVSMTPHADMLRMYATQFAGETGLPVSALGVVQDNPSSAEAIYAAKEDLVIEAEAVGATFAPALVRSALTAAQILHGTARGLEGLGARWMDPSTPSRAAATDAVMKQVQTGILPAESDVTLEQLGMDETTVRRVQADRRRSAGRDVLASLRQNARSAPLSPLIGDVESGS